MGYNIDKYIAILKNEDGYLEKRKNCPTSALYDKVGNYVGADNWTKYWLDLKNIGLPNYQGSYYCITTLFWGMTKAFGLKAAQELCLQNFMINCQYTYNLFKNKGQIYTTPKIGDIVVFWNGNKFHHAEAVTSVKGDVVKTFGANTTAVTSVTVYNGGGCRYNKVYSLKAMQAAGHKFLRPKYGEQIEERWVLSGNEWKYLMDDGNFAMGTWKYINNKWYLFDNNGYMLRGWQLSNGQWYYLCGNGDMLEGWQKIDDKWYFLNSPNGEMHVGWLQDGTAWYYLENDGHMVCNCMKEINGVFYMFLENGVMVSNTWFEKNNDWYYFSSTGAMVKNEWRQDKNGLWYYLGEDGKMVINCIVKDKITDDYYLVDDKGAWDGKLIKLVDELPEGVKIIK